MLEIRWTLGDTVAFVGPKVALLCPATISISVAQLWQSVSQVDQTEPIEQLLESLPQAQSGFSYAILAYSEKKLSAAVRGDVQLQVEYATGTTQLSAANQVDHHYIEDPLRVFAQLNLAQRIEGMVDLPIVQGVVPAAALTFEFAGEGDSSAQVAAGGVASQEASDEGEAAEAAEAPTEADAVEEGTVEGGAVEGTVEEGIVEGGTVEEGAVEPESAEEGEAADAEGTQADATEADGTEANGTEAEDEAADAEAADAEEADAEEVDAEEADNAEADAEAADTAQAEAEDEAEAGDVEAEDTDVEDTDVEDTEADESAEAEVEADLSEEAGTSTETDAAEPQFPPAPAVPVPEPPLPQESAPAEDLEEDYQAEAEDEAEAEVETDEAEAGGYGQIRMSDGRVLDITPTMVFGRMPALPRDSDRQAPQLVVVNSPRALVSRSHCMVTAEDGKVTLIDMHSNNGTYLRGEDESITKVNPGERMALQVGDVVDLGDDVSFEVINLD